MDVRPGPRAPSPRRHWRLRGTVQAGLIVLAILVIVQLWRTAGDDQPTGPSDSPAPPPPIEQAVYVWQRQWTPAVRTAVGRLAAHDLSLMILAAEAAAREGTLVCTPIAVDWPAVAAAGRPAWLVLRADVSLAGRLADRRDATAAQVLGLYARGALAAAREAGVALSGLQLDYDCPTARLADYAAFLAALRKELPEATPLAITALPDWLDRPWFVPLVTGLDHFVLQVHSLEKPATINDPVHLCDSRKAAEWIDQAGGAGTAFYVALPTYGYRVVFDPDGRFAALSAEGPPPAYPRGYRLGLVMADPVEMAALARRLREIRPATCRGIAWFRLPTEADELCWTEATFEAVLAGRPPAVSFMAEVRTPERDLWEVWLANSGERNIGQQVTFDVIVVAGREVVAQDVLAGFTADGAGPASRLKLSGPAPAVGHPAMVAWFRLKPGPPNESPSGASPNDSSATASPIIVTQVEVLP